MLRPTSLRRQRKAAERDKEQNKPAASAPETVTVPDIGDFKEVEVIEVLVKAGDTVTKEQSLITLESDKATMEIPSPAAGVVKELKVKVGDKVSEGQPVLVIESGRRRAGGATRPSPQRAGRGADVAAPVAAVPMSAPPAPCPSEPKEANAPRGRMPALRCASSRASSASTLPRCAAAGQRDASRTTTCRHSSRAS